MKGKLVSQVTLQYYRRNYCLVCMTGLLGCRWHRYKQSTRDSRKRDLFWFTLFTLTFLYITFYFYFWLIARNSYDGFNWYMYQALKTWIPWYRITLGLICATFAYFIIVMILLLCHVIHGHQLYIHPFHIVIIVLSLACSVAVTIVIDMIWSPEWATLLLSLKITGPFLQIGAVILMTALTWLISLQWFKLSHWGFKVFWLCFFIAVMICLYISPLFINSPCVTHAKHLPPRPKLIAHRGSSWYLPENTLMSFQAGFEEDTLGIESDVSFSSDCVPVILHDKTFERTTNIRDVFPDRAKDSPYTFNISEIRSLDAGSWFLSTNPFQTAGDLSEDKRAEVAEQKIPTLEELAALASNYTDKVILFDFKVPLESHPCYNITLNNTLKALRDSGLPFSKVWWLTNGSNQTEPPGVVTVASPKISVEDFVLKNISVLNTQYTLLLNSDTYQKYKEKNISVNVWTVNSDWYFSLCWCLGVDTVTSDKTAVLQNLQAPVWHLVPSSYLVLWVTVDVLSAVIIITIFIVQRIRFYGTSFTPEIISLNSAARSAQGAVRQRTMKDRLLINMSDSENVEDQSAGRPGLSDNSAYSMASINNESGAVRFYNGNAAQPDSKYEVE